MAEIAITDLSAATRARFVDDDAAQAALDAVLAAARRYCGWHVSPVKTGDVITLDGPGSSAVELPTRKLVTITSVVELGTTLDLTKVDSSTGGRSSAVVLRKRSGGWWSCRYRSIVVTMTHGFTEAEAADWRHTIIDLVDDVSYVVAAGSGDTGPLIRKKVDDVEYQWGDITSTASQAVYSAGSVLDGYRLPEVLFV